MHVIDTELGRDVGGRPRVVARQTGLTAKAVRLYERKGLLPPAERTPAGYRLFTDDDLDTLTFIRQAKTLGLSLDEIDRTITELRRLRTALTRTRSDAAETAGDTGGVCRIIEHSTRTSRPDGQRRTAPGHRS